jgi:hypothetical protein
MLSTDTGMTPYTVQHWYVGWPNPGAMNTIENGLSY